MSKNIRKVAVIGPNADNCYNMLGDYTAPQKDENIKTVLDGIISKLSLSRVEYVRGCAIRDTTNNEIAILKRLIKRRELLLQIKAKSVIWSVEKALIVQLFLC